MSLELISFVTCPFVQRAVIMLNEKGQPFSTRFIDLANKPDWFLQLSPRGKVPLLHQGDDVLFESQAICEYLDDAFEPQLRSDDLIARARERAFFAMAGEDLFGAAWFFETASTPEKQEKARDKLRTTLQRLSEELGDNDYLSGDGTSFGIADIGVAPFFTRAAKYKSLGEDLLTDWPNLQAWSARILARPSVQNSLPDAWDESFDAAVVKHEALIGQAA